MRIGCNIMELFLCEDCDTLATVEVFSDFNVTGNIHATGNITADGNITFGSNNPTGEDNVTFNADVASNIIPDLNNEYTLGNTDKRWADVWTTNLWSNNVIVRKICLRWLRR